MRVAALFCGDVRDLDISKTAISAMKENLAPYEFETFLFAHKTSLSESLMGMVDNSILLREIDRFELENKYITSRCATAGQNGHAYPGNTFKMFNRIRMAVDMVMALPKQYDYFVYCRPDVKLRLDISRYFTENLYAVIDAENSVGVNDQMGIAKPLIMKKAWNYGTIDSFNDVYGRSHNPEHFLKNVMDINGVASIKLPFISYKFRELPERT